MVQTPFLTEASHLPCVPSGTAPADTNVASSATAPCGPSHLTGDSAVCNTAAQTADFLSHAELLIAISTAHLQPRTRQRLADGRLSVLAYPNEYGGFVYVGSAGENVPREPELATIFAMASLAGVVWIKFDSDAAVVRGLPVFDDAF